MTLHTLSALKIDTNCVRKRAREEKYQAKYPKGNEIAWRVQSGIYSGVNRIK